MALKSLLGGRLDLSGKINEHLIYQFQRSDKLDWVCVYVFLLLHEITMICSAFLSSVTPRLYAFSVFTIPVSRAVL